MRFAAPYILYWLWLGLPLAFLLVSVHRRRRAALRRFAHDEVLAELAGAYDPRRDVLKGLLLMLVFVFGIIALARPQWGFEWREVKRQGLDILLVIDTSRSMLTEDVKPNRLERTKLAVKDLVRKLKGDRVGLITFAGKAFLLCPLTVDYAGFLMTLEAVDTTAVPRGGTNLAAAIHEALQEYDATPSKYKALIILTDGDNLEGDPLAEARLAKEKGVKIFCLGIGTREGELIRVLNQEGQPEFLKDAQGNFVKSRLNESLLQQIALETGGVYVRAGGADFGLDVIYDQQLSRFERRDIEDKMEQRYDERFQIPLALALGLLTLETLLPRTRRRTSA